MMRGKERGSTAILVAVALLMLMGFASLAIDAGLGFDDRRGTQNAADLAALAAAWQDCNPGSGGSPTNVARATSVNNGYDHSYPDVQVLVSNPAADTWRVEIRETNDATFGEATPYAPNQLDILSEATAACIEVGILGGFAVFGQSEACSQDTVDMSGNNITILGGVHSNQDVKITGSGPSVSGESTYRRNDQTAGSITASEYYGSSLGYPITLDIAEYRPTGSRAVAAGSDYYDLPGDDIDAALMVSEGHATTSPPWLEIDTPGIYYANGDISFNRVRLVGAAAAQGVTFVAEGQVDLGTTEDLQGFDPYGSGSGPSVMVFANGGGSADCNAKDVKISGSDVAWEGIVFAPFGVVEMSASGISSLNGSVIAYRVNLSGANLTVQYEDDPNTDPTYRVELVD